MEPYAATIRSSLANRGTAPHDANGYIKKVTDGGRLARSASHYYHLSDDSIAERFAEARAHLHASLESLADAAEVRELLPRTAAAKAAVDKTRMLVLAALEKIDYVQPRSELSPEVSRVKVTKPSKLYAALPAQAAYEAVAPSLQMASKALSAYALKNSGAPDLVKLALDVHKQIFTTPAEQKGSLIENIVPLDDYCTHLDSAITNLAGARLSTHLNTDFAKIVELEQKIVRLWRSARVRTIFDSCNLNEYIVEGKNNLNMSIAHIREQFNADQLDEFRRRIKQYYDFTESHDIQNRFNHFRRQHYYRANIRDFMHVYETTFHPPHTLIARNSRDIHESQAFASASACLRLARGSIQTAIDQFLHLDLSLIPKAAIAQNTHETLHSALAEVERLLRNYDVRELEPLENAEQNDKQFGWLHSSIVPELGREIAHRPVSRGTARSSSIDSQDSSLTAFGSLGSRSVTDSEMSWVPGTQASASSSAQSSDRSDTSMSRSSFSGTETPELASLRQHIRRLSQSLHPRLINEKQFNVFRALCSEQANEFDVRAHDLNVELATTIIGHLACNERWINEVESTMVEPPFRRALELIGNHSIASEKRALLLGYTMVAAEHLYADNGNRNLLDYHKAESAYRELLNDRSLSKATKRHLTLVASRALTRTNSAVFVGKAREDLYADVWRETNDRGQSPLLQGPALHPLTQNLEPISRYTDRAFLQGAGESSLYEQVLRSHSSDEEVFSQQHNLFVHRLENAD